MANDINTPLGQNRRPPRRKARRPSAKSVLAAGATLAVFLASFYTALAPDPLRRPEPPEQLIAEAGSTPLPPQNAVAPQAAAAKPDIAGIDGTSRRSGAAISETVTGDGDTVTIFRPGDRPADGAVILDGGVGQDLRVAHLPEPGLIEESAFGGLPTLGPNGERPLDAYARSWSGARGTRIAIVVGGLGLSQTGTQYAIQQLPEEVTLAFAASGNSLQRWMQEARRGGHELLLQVPFEPFNYPAVDPGPNTLTVAAGAESNIEDLHRSMTQITNYTGIMNYMGGRFLADVEALEPVMRDLADRGVLFLDDGTSAQSESDMLARTLGVPFAAGDMVLDRVRERGAILQQLDALERAAVRSGSAIGIASAFEVSVDAIAAWIEEASARNIEIVGVSAVVDDPARP